MTGTQGLAVRCLRVGSVVEKVVCLHLPEPVDGYHNGTYPVPYLLLGRRPTIFLDLYTSRVFDGSKGLFPIGSMVAQLT